MIKPKAQCSVWCYFFTSWNAYFFPRYENHLFNEKDWILKKKKSTRVKVFHKGRSLKLVQNVGCWALWSSWAEVLAAFCELIPSVETLWDDKESFERAGIVYLWPSLQKACILGEVLIFWDFLWSCSNMEFDWVSEVDCRWRGKGGGRECSWERAPLLQVGVGSGWHKDHPLLPAPPAPVSVLETVVVKGQISPLSTFPARYTKMGISE